MLIAFFIVAVLTRPEQLPYPATPLIDLERCGYEQSAEAAERANARREQPSSSRSDRLNRQISNEAEAAQQRQAAAYECEQRLRGDADLAAQQQAAIANRNAAEIALSLRWAGYLELFFLMLTIGVGVAAIVATTEQGNAQRAQAQEHFYAGRRASLDVVVRVGRVFRTYHGFAATARVEIANVGSGAATHVAMQWREPTEDFGAKEDLDFATEIEMDRNRPIEPGVIIPPDPTKPAHMERFITIKKDHAADTGGFAGNFHVSGWVRYRFDGAKHYHVTPFVRFVSFIEDTDDPGVFVVIDTPQGTKVVPT